VEEKVPSRNRTVTSVMAAAFGWLNREWPNNLYTLAYLPSCGKALPCLL
jgi:hypothetical protein